MTINEYQKEALRTAPTWWPNPFEPLKNGQAIDILKKQLFQGRPLDREHLAKELGDVARYLAVSAAALGYTLEEILEMNVKSGNNRPAVDAEPVRRAQWISVEDELPKEEGKYIVCTERGSVYCTRFYKGGGCEGIFKTDINTHIAYWMPLPEAPKEGE